MVGRAIKSESGGSKVGLGMRTKRKDIATHQDTASKTQHAPDARDEYGASSLHQTQTGYGVSTFVEKIVICQGFCDDQVFYNTRHLHHLICGPHVFTLTSFCLGVPWMAMSIVLLAVRENLTIRQFGNFVLIWPSTLYDISAMISDARSWVLGRLIRPK